MEKLRHPIDWSTIKAAFADHLKCQDVYKPSVRGRTLYVKFTLDGRGALFLISFKEA